MPRAAVLTIAVACLASLGSVAMTYGVYLVIGLKEPRVAFTLATVCPLIIAPPLVYWSFRKNDRIAALNQALAASNAELAVAKRSLEEMMRKDGLTGLLNRTAFFAAIDETLQSAGGCLLMLDIDHFKAINDEHGHAAGDDVLVVVGHALAAALPPGSFAGRLGGEEFGVFLPGIGIGEALIYAEALRQRLGADIGTRSGLGRLVTVSVGAAAVDKQGDIAALYRTSDAALYRAKREGRNRVAAGGQIPTC